MQTPDLAAERQASKTQPLSYPCQPASFSLCLFLHPSCECEPHRTSLCLSVFCLHVGAVCQPPATAGLSCTHQHSQGADVRTKSFLALAHLAASHCTSLLQGHTRTHMPVCPPASLNPSLGLERKSARFWQGCPFKSNMLNNCFKETQPFKHPTTAT